MRRRRKPPGHARTPIPAPDPPRQDMAPSGGVPQGLGNGFCLVPGCPFGGEDLSRGNALAYQDPPPRRRIPKPPPDSPAGTTPPPIRLDPPQLPPPPPPPPSFDR